MIIKFKDFLNEAVTNQFFKTYEETKDWLDLMKIKNYIINDNLTVDVNDIVDLYNKKLTYIPVQFGKVTGYFYCYNNSLTSLKGCPSTVGGDFICSENKLTSLKGCPSTVDGRLNCSYNKLTSLEGCPSTIGGDFYCSYNKLTSLKGYSIYNFKKNIKKIWYKDLSQKIKEEYFDKNLDENPEIISLIDFDLSKKFKNKWEHLFNAKKFDLI